ncbi:MAG: bifunctional diaminohydroxyphosphoribosylaminopyrimidine deaminase/5-amino-6-(5-phosphoribosylamino)uracil reductase RibD [Alphaproteobacteria bacterium]
MFDIPMQLACAEARKYLGATSPNPPVGAVALDANGTILATAAHRRAGDDHAEAALLKICREKNLLKDVHTLCVTLEPCNHHGRTPPCTDAIIEAGIKRVVIGARDPNPKVKGGGIETLKETGIEIICGVNENECQQLIHVFSYHATTGKPWITIKRAINRDGTMIPISGQKTFTSQSSLLLAHRLRKKADAILTGSGTIVKDDPLFTVRHIADYPNKKRILAIMDLDNKVPNDYIKAAEQRGFKVSVYKDVKTAIDDLTNKGVQDILVEAGPSLSQAMFDYHFWNISVTIQQADPDKITVEFNPSEPLPFKKDSFSWDYFLPA